MRILLISLTFALMSESSVFAEEFHPFVAGSFHVNVPTSGFENRDFAHHQGGARTGIGQEVDAGLTVRSLDPYLGFRWAHFDARGHMQIGSQNYRVDGVWRLFRWVLGVRWTPIQRPGVSTTLGGGFTWAKSDIDLRAVDSHPKLSTVKMSGPSLGWFAESGVLLPTGRRLDLIGNLQFHHYTSPVKSRAAGLLHGSVPISYVTVTAGLKVNLF